MMTVILSDSIHDFLILRITLYAKSSRLISQYLFALRRIGKRESSLQHLHYYNLFFNLVGEE